MLSPWWRDSDQLYLQDVRRHDSLVVLEQLVCCELLWERARLHDDAHVLCEAEESVRVRAFRSWCACVTRHEPASASGCKPSKASAGQRKHRECEEGTRAK